MEAMQAGKNGKIGITLVCHWMVPVFEAKIDKDAAQHAIDFMFGWFMDPLTYGNYPRSMQSLVGNRLPKYLEEQSRIVKGLYNFLGQNYYIANYVRNAMLSKDVPPSYLTNFHARLSCKLKYIQIGFHSSSKCLLYC
ncbi:hypothetical protein IFM89_004424 [Coptis chinensis]|uniref:Beta-glucosidase n=1 Tax=Coptis chinensis TaxID=261450 RepID=A0A835IJJ0_9MAGN|nr:hypothetical protein IFM89_004424 [Coptis chinensis]